MARPRKGQEKHAAERVAFRIPKWVRADSIACRPIARPRCPTSPTRL